MIGAAARYIRPQQIATRLQTVIQVGSQARRGFKAAGPVVSSGVNLITPPTCSSESQAPHPPFDSVFQPGSVCDAMVRGGLADVARAMNRLPDFRAEETEPSPLRINPLQLAFGMGRYEEMVLMASHPGRGGDTAMHRLAASQGERSEIGWALSAAFYLGLCPTKLTRIQNESGETPGHIALRANALHRISRDVLIGLSPLGLPDGSGHTVSSLADHHPDDNLRLMVALGRQDQDRLFIPAVFGKVGYVFVRSSQLYPRPVPTFSPDDGTGFERQMRRFSETEDQEALYLSMEINGTRYWINPTILQMVHEGQAISGVPNINFARLDRSAHYHPQSIMKDTYDRVVVDIRQDVMNEQGYDLENKSVQTQIHKRADLVVEWKHHLPSVQDVMAYMIFGIKGKTHVIFMRQYRVVVELLQDEINTAELHKATQVIQDELYRLDSPINTLDRALEATRHMWRRIGVNLAYERWGQ